MGGKLVAQFKRLSGEKASWDAHVKRAASSPIIAAEYKKSGWKLDTHKVMSNRIKNGEGVGHYWLEGKLKKELLEMTDITEDDFKKYLDPAAQTQYIRPYNNGEN